MQELESLFQLLAMLVTDPRTSVLLVLMIIAAIIDYRTYRIPNWLTLSGAAFGLIYSAAVPLSPHMGFLWSLGGFALGFFFMLPMYALKVMGAGDVKLMAMAGAFLGVDGVWQAAVCTFIVGGVLALGFAFFRGSLGRMLVNVKNIAGAAVFSATGGMRPDLQVKADASVGKLPYGLSISIGTIGYMLANQLGYL